MSVEPFALVAQLNLTEQVFWGIRFLAGLVGALFGWYASGPMTRLAYRLSFHRPIPGWLLPWVKLVGAAAAGLLAFYLIPLGTGGSGLGWGAGLGGGPGKGTGSPTDTVTMSQAKKEGTAVPRSKSSRELIDIELLGGKNYPGEGRYYLLSRTGPPRTLEEVKEFLKKNRDKIEVHIVLTEQSVAPHHGAVGRLRDLLDEDRIPTLEIVEGEAGPAKR